MLSSWLSCWHMALMLLGFSLTGEDSGIGGKEKPLWREGRSPEASRDMARCRSMLERSLLSRRDSCLLKVDVWLRLPKPRKEPCICSIETVACGCSIAYGFTTDFTGGGLRWLGLLWVLGQAVGDGALPEGARPGEARGLGFEVYQHALLVTLLLALQAHRKRAAHRVAQPLARVPDGQEAVAHSAPDGAVPADVREAPVVVAVGGAERHLLNGLVHQELPGAVVHHPQQVPRHVQGTAHGATPRVAQHL
ncbi:unnamed protein product [Ixodes pacificus]